MLQRLREKAQGWFAWAILGAIAVTFVLFGTANVFESGRSEQAVATVNGSAITYLELENAYQHVLQSPGAEGLRQMDPLQVKRELLDSIIEERILLQDAKKLGLAVNEEAITQWIAGRFAKEDYGQFLASANFSDQHFRSLLRDSMLLQQLQQSIVGTAFALSSDVAEYVKYGQQKRNFRYTTIDNDVFQKKVVVTEEQLRDYYHQHASEFMFPEKVALEYLVLSVDDILKDVLYSDDDLQHFYHDNMGAFTVPASAQVAHILINVPQQAEPAVREAAQKKIAMIQQRLQAGESFESLAKAYSDDKASAEKGGLLEWFTAGEMVPEFEKAAFALSPGETSGPVSTAFGYHLVKLIDKKPQEAKPFSTVKEEVIEKYKRYQAEEVLAALSDEVAQLAFDTPDSLEPVAEKIGKPIQKTSLFSQEEGASNTLLDRPEVISLAFSAHLKEDKNNSDLIKLDEGQYLVMRVADWVSSKQKPLDVVRPEINLKLLTDQTKQLLKQEAERTVQSLLKDPKAADALQWTNQENIERTHRNIDAYLLEAVFSMPRPEKKVPDFKTAALSNGDYAIIELTDVKDGELGSLTEAEKKNYQDDLQKHEGRLELALYVTDLIEHAQVKKTAITE